MHRGRKPAQQSRSSSPPSRAAGTATATRDTPTPWDGRGQGSPAGHRFFFSLIRHCGVGAAYPFVVPACLRYALCDARAAAGISALRRRLGLRDSWLHRYPHFVSFGITLVDRVAFLQGARSSFGYECIHEEYIARALARGRGVILLGAHTGNWEIAANLIGERVGSRVHAVMLEAEHEQLRRTWEEATSSRRFESIPLTPDGVGTTLAIMAALRGNGIVAMLGDRTLDGRSMAVPFLGSAVPFPVGPFAVAAAARTVLIPVFTHRCGPKRYRFQAFDPIDFSHVSRQQRSEALAAGVRSFARTLEELTRRYPRQWYNFYDFWGSGGG